MSTANDLQRKADQQRHDAIDSLNRASSTRRDSERKFYTGCADTAQFRAQQYQRAADQQRRREAATW